MLLMKINIINQTNELVAMTVNNIRISFFILSCLLEVMFYDFSDAIQQVGLGGLLLVYRLQIPVDTPAETGTGLQFGIGTLTLQFDIRFSAVHIHLYFSLAGCGLLRFQVAELFHEQQVVGIERQPSLAVGIDLAVLTRLVGAVPHAAVLCLEVHQVGRPYLVAGSLEEDESVVVDHAGNLPRCHAAHLLALVLDGVGYHEAALLGVGLEVLGDAEP